MSSKLIALAVATSCATPAVMAQTASPVILYGRVYMTLESVETKGGSGALPQRIRVEDQSSYLGVRGTEDLGGGVKAFFQLETSFRPDSNNSTFANRNSAIGLQGSSWGSVLAGRWDMPFKTATTAIDAFGDLTIGGITSGANDRGNFNVRHQNVIQYWSPSWSGFAVKLAYGANEGKTATANPEAYGASLVYSKGPLYLAYAYEEHRDGNGGLTTVTSGYKEEGNAIVGRFQVGAVKLGALYQTFDKTGRTKQDTYMVNAVWTNGKHDFSIQYTDSQDGGANGAAQPECQVIAAGWQYNWTKRTFFLAQYAKTDNNAAASCRIGSFVGAAGDDPEGFSLGLRHIF